MKAPTKILTVLISALCYGYFLFYSTIPGKIMMMNKNIIVEGNAYEEVWRIYGKLPQHLREMLWDNNYRIYIVNEIQNNENIMGSTYYGPRIILIKNDMYFIDNTIYHEIGHVLDDKSHILYASGTEEFIDIYTEEKDNFVVDNNYDYFVSDEKEYFASAFAEYMLNPNRLKENTPKTYEFIRKCIEE